MKHTLSVLLVFLSITLSFGQNVVQQYAGFKAAVGIQDNYPYLELGFARSVVGKQILTFSASSEFTYSKKDKTLIVGPKLSYEFFVVPGPFGPGAKLSVVDYTNFKDHQLAIVPEVSLHVIGILGIGYGYNINLKEFNNLMYNPTHKFSIFLNLQRQIR